MALNNWISTEILSQLDEEVQIIFISQTAKYPLLVYIISLWIDCAYAPAPIFGSFLCLSVRIYF